MTQQAAADRRPAHRGVVPVAAVVVLAAFAVLVLATTPSLNPLDVFLGDAFKVSVPKVSGMTQTRALLDLEGHRLHGRVSFAHSSTVSRGQVIAQRPAAGRLVGRAGTIDLVVSRGPSRVVLENYAGQAERDVRRVLRRAGVDVRVQRLNSETVPAGSVLDQRPSAGVTVEGGTVVELDVSLGPARRTVPDLAKIPVEGALFLLGKAGFSLGTVTTVDDPKMPEGRVLSTAPAPGTQLDRDTPVNVTVSNGPPPITVPNVIGSPEADAGTRLAALGFNVGELPQIGVDADPQDGKVVLQTPDAGAMLRPGETVTLTVRRSPPPTTTTTAPPPPAAPGPGG